MLNILNVVLSALNFLPGMKTKLAAVCAFGLAVISAFNAMAPELNIAYTITVPEFVQAAVLALLGVGAANQQANSK
jgi:hypothetical protein